MANEKLDAYAIVDWRKDSAANQHPIVAVLDPENPVLGQDFLVKVYCRHDVALHSPYNGIKSGRSVLPAETFEEYQNVSGNRIGTDKPVAKLNKCFVWTPLIDLVNRVIYKFGNVNALSFVSTVLDRLVIKSMESLHGTLYVNYDSYPAQVWTHGGFSRHGAYMLFAYDAVEGIWYEIPISIADPAAGKSDATSSIEIQGVPLRTSYYGLQGGPYANFIILPRDAGITVKTDKGRVEFVKEYEYAIKGESITLDGSGLQALKYPVYKITGVVGAVNIAGGVRGGKFAYPKNLTGQFFVSYVTIASLYDYYAEVNNIPGGVVDLQPGIIFAFNESANATYTIPERQWPNDESVVITVWYETVIGESDFGAGEFELPPGYPSNMAYPRSFAIQDLLRRYPWTKQRKNAEQVTLQSNQLTPKEFDYRTVAPYNGLPFPERVYHVEKSVPSGASASIVAQINEIELALRAKYSQIGQVV